MRMDEIVGRDQAIASKSHNSHSPSLLVLIAQLLHCLKLHKTTSHTAPNAHTATKTYINSTCTEGLFLALKTPDILNGCYTCYTILRALRQGCVACLAPSQCSVVPLPHKVASSSIWSLTTNRTCCCLIVPYYYNIVGWHSHHHFVLTAPQ